MRPRLLLALLLLALFGCTPSDPEPTIDPNAPTRLLTMQPLAPTVTASPRAVPEERPALPATVAAVDPSLPANPALPPVSADAATPLAVGGGGVRPGAIAVTRLVTPQPIPSPEWRPPPYEVPLALHPDDHYYFMRPIPSGSRNYDLEWYPYGNDVLLPELYPYRVHHGLDFPNPPGTPILAADDGVVIFAGVRPSPRNGVNYYGNTVIIRHDWQWQGAEVYTLYAHTLELFVAEGDRVSRGQLIAGVGQSGDVSGPHLHFEVRIGANNYFDVRNPQLWIAPFEGYGTLAGRFVDQRGTPIRSGRVVVRALDGSGLTRTVLTYYDRSVLPDEVYRENFVVGDLPAGRYRVEFFTGDTGYARTVDILPARTNIVLVQADITVVPTVTPTRDLAPTPPLTGTLPVDVTPATTTPSP